MGKKYNAGVYMITHRDSNRVYIGSSKQLDRRLKKHKYNLNKGIHENPYLQNCWLKHGEESFDFQIILFCDEKDNLMYEQKFMDFYKCYEEEFGFNINKLASSRLGYTMSDDQKEKLRQANLGKKHSEETKEKLRISNTGKRHTQEAKDKVSKAKIGVKHSEERREKSSKGHMGQEAWNKGQKMTDEYTELQQEKRMQTLRSNNTSISEYCKRGWETRRANKLKKQQELNQETIDNGTTGT